MRAVIQRVSQATVSVDNSIKGSIEKGLLILLGVGQNDTPKDIQWIVDKIINLRIFEGETGKLDLSVQDIKGKILVVSQFTLYGKCDKGRRPDFTSAAPVDKAQEVYEKAIQAFEQTGIPIQQGEFQAHMKIELLNDGPVTLILESPKKQ